MNILVVDAQGGGIGKQLVSSMKQSMSGVNIWAVGTNTAATAAMLKAGADQAATGENAVVVAARKADIIVGPIGIVIADALLGEITPVMAKAIAQSNARRVFIPFNHCDNIIVGVSNYSTGKLIQEAVAEIQKFCESEMRRSCGKQ